MADNTPSLVVFALPLNARRNEMKAAIAEELVCRGLGQRAVERLSDSTPYEYARRTNAA